MTARPPDTDRSDAAVRRMYDEVSAWCPLVDVAYHDRLGWSASLWDRLAFCEPAADEHIEFIQCRNTPSVQNAPLLSPARLLDAPPPSTPSLGHVTLRHDHVPTLQSRRIAPRPASPAATARPRRRPGRQQDAG